MELNLKFHKGQKVFVRINNKYTVQTITGNVTIRIDSDDNVSYSYEIDLCQPGYETLKEFVSPENIFTSVQDIMEKAGISTLDDSMLQ